jgi:Lysophospholipase
MFGAIHMLVSMMLTTASGTANKIMKRALTSVSLNQATDVIISCTDGIEIAARKWPAPRPDDSKERVLLLHGWLDNAASFNLLAPKLNAMLNREIVAIDFPGHGHSSHKSPDGPTQLVSEYAYYVGETLESLNWIESESFGKTHGKEVILVGHSMGAAVSLMYAAAFPEHVSKIVLLEGAGPLSRNPNDISRHIRSSVIRRIKSNKTLFAKDEDGRMNVCRGHKKFYKNLGAAVAARKKTAELVPGNQWISTEASEAIVCRATMPRDDFVHHDATKAGGKELAMSFEGEVVFRHDSRLTWPSLQYFSKEQVQAIYHDVQCPTCLILANDGWPGDDWSGHAIENILRPKKNIKLPGSHHFHADPETSDVVIEEVVDFLKDKPNV